MSAAASEVRGRRLEWVDAFKGIGILLVIVGHTSRIPEVTQWIYSFHMPLFFWLSGYLFHARPPRQFVRRKAFTLLVPYLFFGVVTWLFWALIENDYSDNPAAALPALQNLFVGKAGNVNNPSNAPLWFLLCLFMTECAFLFLFLGMQKLARKAFSGRDLSAIRSAERLRLTLILAACALLGVGGAMLIHAKLQRLPLTLDVVPVALAFMGMGYLSKEISQRVKAAHAVARWWDEFRLYTRLGLQLHSAATGRTRVIGAGRRVRFLHAALVGVVVPLTIAALVEVQLRGHGVHVDLANDVMRIPSVAYMAAVAMIFAGYLVTTTFHPRFLQYLGNASIVVLGVHDVAKHEFIEVIADATGLSKTAVRTTPLWVGVISVLILATSLIAYEFVQRVLPFVIGKKTAVRTTAKAARPSDGKAWIREHLQGYPLPSYHMPIVTQMQRI